MRLFVDDVRNPPDDGEWWIVARTAAEAMQSLELYGMALRGLGYTNINNSILSLDHDLGDADTLTGYDIAAWLEKEVITNGMIPPKYLRVHSANPVGRDRILQCFRSIIRFWEQAGKQEIPEIIP
jgi:hypothetical protein